MTSPAHGDALERLFSRIGQLSSLPSVAQGVLHVAENESSCTADLLRVVEQDPTLAIRIMRTVNSSYYGISNEIADLHTAISLLGFVEVRNLALTVYVARLCEQPSEYRGFTREKLWRHMVTVGTIARALAKICRVAAPDEAYMAGLLHDVGLLLVDQYMHQPLCTVIDMVNDGVGTLEAERQVLTFDHTDLGTYIAAKSNFPERISVAIQYHHNPSEYTGDDRELLAAVSLADYFATQQDITSLGVKNIPEPTVQVCDSLGLSQEQLPKIWEQILPTLESAQVLATI